MPSTSLQGSSMRQRANKWIEIGTIAWPATLLEAEAYNERTGQEKEAVP